MGDRHPQYTMMPNFNPSMLQQQQMQQQSQQQQQQQDGHQGMQSFSEQNPLWSQMGLQAFRQNNGGDMSNPQMQEMANLIQSQSFAQQQQRFSAMGGANGNGPQQPPFHDPSAQQRNLLLAGGGFPGLGNQATLSQPSMQARAAMMQAFNNNSRQLNLIDMAGNQQNQHSFPPRMNPTAPHPGVNQVNPNDIFSSTMNNNHMRQPSPARPAGMPTNQHPIQPTLNGQPRTQVPIDMQQKIHQIRSHIHQTEQSLRQLHSNRGNMAEAVFMQQATNHQNELSKGKEMLSRLIHIATQQGQQQKPQSLQPQNQTQPNQMPIGAGPLNQPSGSSQTPWIQSNGSPSQGPPFNQPSNLSTTTMNTQPSPSQRHTQPPNQNIVMPPNRTIPTPHQPSQQTNNFPMKPPGVASPPSAMGGQMPALDKDRFEKAFENFLKHRNVTRDVRAITVEGRPLDFHHLHTVVFSEGGYGSVTQRDLWPVVAGRIGFIQFPGSDVEPPKSGPGTAHQIEQIYKEFLVPFDTAYMSTVMDARRKSAMMSAGQGPLMQGNNPQNPLARGPMNPQQMQRIISYADQSVEQLRANHVAENIIAFVESNRANLQRAALEQKAFRTQIPNAGPNPINPGMPGNRAFPTASPAMLHPNAPGLSPPQFPSGQDHSTPVNNMQAVIQNPARANQEQLARISSVLNQMKQEFLTNRLHNLPPVNVPPEQRMEYNAVVEQLHHSASELDAKLPMLFLFLKNEAWIRKVAIIVVTVQQQRSFLSSANPRFIVSLDNLRHMLAEVHKAHEGFNSTMANHGMGSLNRPLTQHPTPQSSTPAILSSQPSATPQFPPNRPPPPPPPTVAPVAPPPQRITKKGSIQPGGAPSPTPPPLASASTPAANPPTPSSTINAASPKSPKPKPKPKTAAPPKRRLSKVPSTPTTDPATLPVSSPSNGVKRPREEDVPSTNGAVVTPPFTGSVANEPSPPKKIKTDWEGPPNDSLKQREEQAVKVETEEDASNFLEQMTELIKMAAGGEGQESSLSSDISDTLDIILKGYGSVPDSSSGGSLGTSGLDGSHPVSPPLPSVDEFEFFDFSSFETGAAADEDDAGSKAATPDLVSSSSTNPSPESASEADATHHALTFSDLKTEEPADPLRLSTMKEVDGGESAYYQLTDWKWDGPMATVDQPWALTLS